MIDRLAVTGLSLARGDRTLFSGLDFELSPGQAAALIGANGAGKTTLLRAIAGFVRPAAGSIRLDGGAEEVELRRGGLHLVGHQDGLKSGRTAGEELSFQVAWTGGKPPPAREAMLTAAIDTLDLRPLLPLEVRKLSAGQRKRLALGRLLASPRPLWLLDEPLSPLDAHWRRQFGELMERHLNGGGMIVAAVHDPLPIAARIVEIA